MPRARVRFAGGGPVAKSVREIKGLPSPRSNSKGEEKEEEKIRAHLHSMFGVMDLDVLGRGDIGGQC